MQIIVTSDTGIIDSIRQWNSDAGLLDKLYEDHKECSYQIEEALEGFSGLQKLAAKIASPDASPKQISRTITKLVQNQGGNIPDVDRFDKHLDSIVYDFGSLFKLGLTSEQVMRGLAAVMNANQQKIGSPLDSEGKQTKPADFIPPEDILQQILDERN